MKPLRLPLAAFIGACMIPTAAMAAGDLSYTYIEAGYLVQDVDMYEDNQIFNNVLEDFDDGDGFEIEGSVAFTDNFFGFGNYSKTSADFTFVDDAGLRIPRGQDVKTLTVGVGYNRPIAVGQGQTDFVARAAYFDSDYGDFNLGADDNEINEWDDVDNAFNDLSEDASDGFKLDAGLRSQVIDWLEAGGGIRYTYMESEDDFSVFADLLFEINQSFGISASADFGDNMSTYGVGLRYSF